MKHNVLAAIDVGTNTFRLLIAEVDRDRIKGKATPPSIREICSERVITRLGDGITSDRKIAETSMQRGLDALSSFKTLISEHNVTGSLAVATSALREADNSDEFIRRAKSEAGISIEIISGHDEARLTAEGMMIDMDVPEQAILIDIGGGSTELMFTKMGDPVHIQSLDLGVVYLSSKYMGDDPPLPDMIGAMEREIVKTITSTVNLPGILSDSNIPVIGTAGTVTVLSAMSQNLLSYDHNRIHGSTLSRRSVKEIYSRIALISSEDRSRLLIFDPERLDIIVPGTRILLMLMERFGADEILVSDYGLREGVILELLRRSESYI